MEEFVLDTRVIAALRACAKDGGQGHTYDRAAVQAAEEMGLLVFSFWPSGHWRITERGLSFIMENELAIEEKSL